MSVRLVDLGNEKNSVRLANGQMSTLLARGVFMPAGVFAAERRVYFPDASEPDFADLPAGVEANDSNSLRVTSVGVARACGYAAVALRHAIRLGRKNHRAWVTDSDLGLLLMLDEVIVFLRDCGGFEQR